MAYKVGVVGAAGFAGVELVRLVLNHPEFQLEVITSDAQAGTPLAGMYPAFTGVTDLCFSANADADFASCDVVFLAVPHTAALALAPGLVAQGVSVVDLSADFRLEDPAVYQKWYATPHTAQDLLAKRAFGLPELFPEGLQEAAAKRAQGEAVLVGCAGCYPTATSLAAAPAIRAGLVDTEAVVVVDAISGVTGAGKKATERTHYCFANENLEAYGVATHRHTPEIAQILGLGANLVFTPHLAPLNRGLLSTVTMQLKKDAPVPSKSQLLETYRAFYGKSALVQVVDGQPKTSSVAGTDRAQVGVAVNADAGVIIATGAIDNLGKGAAGQALQCANIICGLDEAAGLSLIACPI